MFGRSGSIQLARVFGIRIGVDVSWFIVLFFFIFILSGSFRTTLDSSDTVAYATAVASALLFFASLVLHELGHALVARRQGIEIMGIDLWFFGGIAKMSRDTESPGDEFKVAVAGPLVTLLVVLLCTGVGVAAAGWNTFSDAATLRHTPDVTPALVLLAWLASINTFVFVFNLIPAFPMDGGRIARAIAWRVSGDRLRATRFAAVLGQVLSYVFIAFGVYLALAGALFTGLWLIVLSLFLGQAARGAVAQTVFAERLGDVKVEDIMDREPVAAPAEIDAERALDEFFRRYRWSWFPVVDATGRFVGIIRQERVEGAVHSADGGRSVGELMEADDGDWRVGSNDSLEALLGSEPLRRHGALMAVDPGGVLRGVVTIEQVRRALQSAVAPQAPSA
jgi:Zn-dependent protease